MRDSATLKGAEWDVLLPLQVFHLQQQEQRLKAALDMNHADLNTLQQDYETCQRPAPCSCLTPPF
jgi:hypothetical protein